MTTEVCAVTLSGVFSECDDRALVQADLLYPLLRPRLATGKLTVALDEQVQVQPRLGWRWRRGCRERRQRFRWRFDSVF